jgi:hypothetical protein
MVMIVVIVMVTIMILATQKKGGDRILDSGSTLLPQSSQRSSQDQYDSREKQQKDTHKMIPKFMLSQQPS